MDRTDRLFIAWALGAILAVCVACALPVVRYRPDDDREPTHCTECVTDAECEALCAPCGPDSEDWTCDRNPNPTED